jgi:hypothetical protein
MNGTITCSVKEASEIMKCLNDDCMVTLTITNRSTHIHSKPKRIKKKKSEELFEVADRIEYQDNDFFGRFSLFGTMKDKDIIQNILFPQLE